jgi:hypothetical protein
MSPRDRAGDPTQSGTIETAKEVRERQTQRSSPRLLAWRAGASAH